MRIDVRQAAIGGLVVALVASVSVGNASPSFWPAFGQALVFALVCVAAVLGALAWVARRQQPHP